MESKVLRIPSLLFQTTVIIVTNCFVIKTNSIKLIKLKLNHSWYSYANKGWSLKT